MGNRALRSLPLSYQKRDWQAGPVNPFVGMTPTRVESQRGRSVKVAEYNSKVGVIPKEGFGGAYPLVLLWV